MTHLFASDYDGTLFKDHQISDDDLMQIKAFRNLGHKFGIVTGRPINSIVLEVNKHGIPVDFMIGINGGVVLSHDYQELHLSSLAHQTVLDVIAEIETQNILYYGLTDGYRIGTVPADAMKTHNKRHDYTLTPVSELLEGKVSSLFVRTGDPAQSYQIAAIINEKFPTDITAYANMDTLDIGSSRVSKATGIEAVVEHYGLAGTVFTIGDAYNDLPMIERFHGFAMDNGVAQVKERARQTFISVGSALQSIMDQEVPS